jgi:hypothetical protein
LRLPRPCGVTALQGYDEKIGAIAQLGERLHGMQEVGGSIPPGSTKSRPLKPLPSGFFVETYLWLTSQKTGSPPILEDLTGHAHIRAVG